MIYDALERVGLTSFISIREGLGRLNEMLVAGMSNRHAEIMTDLVALSAAEMQVVGAGIGGQPSFPLLLQPVTLTFPVLLQPVTLTFALAKTDTLPTWPCKTPERIASGKARLSDCFVFASDFDKAQSILETDSLSTFRESFAQFVLRYIELMTVTPVGRAVSMSREVYLAEAFIWRARLDVLDLQQDAQQTETKLRSLVGLLGIPKPRWLG